MLSILSSFAATVQKESTFYLPLGTVTYDHVLVDVGENFDKTTGQFLVPIDGKYQFMVDGVAYPNGHYSKIYFQVNGVTKRQIDELDDNHYYSANGMFVTELQKGDIVTIYTPCSGIIRGDGIFPFTFFGTLLSDI